MEVSNCIGTLLKEINSINFIKYFRVCRPSCAIRHWAILMNIKLNYDTKEMDGRVDDSTMVLMTKFLKQA